MEVPQRRVPVANGGGLSLWVALELVILQQAGRDGYVLIARTSVALHRVSVQRKLWTRRGRDKILSMQLAGLLPRSGEVSSSGRLMRKRWKRMRTQGNPWILMSETRAPETKSIKVRVTEELAASDSYSR
ncbi:hypothetical protein FOXG_05545 [Fusarium oxysporum f. sp. lycopersici 4287]|uniref:Uncharacterized protein n=1 Tax=Fusarium oxysporum f. sp. lycopersici (strain 4287 / CBS 123668 / FGSC 9935 / NRRL 34936) TaxID=426428 RepID=A0A0J9UWG1_FUSO4|nr:hypothetical protein FOXG_05545 [Fusarium oxysporum f. sp. lycopersici 4287]KNB02881.1 hypothetical protein FOXG_05545 [Fusarium oxysporum f. sp. lycopersici 4287]